MFLSFLPLAAQRSIRCTVLAGFALGMPALALAQAPRLQDMAPATGFASAAVPQAAGDENASGPAHAAPVCAAELPAPLGMSVVTFNGQVRKNGYLLVWTMFSSTNSPAFAVESSADGVSFQNVTEVAPDGSNATINTYCCLDATPAAKATAQRYYRLRQLNPDGTVAFSPVVALRRAASSQRSL